MPRRFDSYRVKRGHNLGDPEYWNGRLEDIDIRIAASESALADLAKVGQEITQLGLERLDNGLTPIILEALERLQAVGEAFSSTSASELTIGTGAKSATLEEDSRASWIGGGYVVIHRVDDNAAFMFGAVTSFDRDTGILEVDVELAGGSGTHSDWAVRTTGARGPQGETGEVASAADVPVTPAGNIVSENVQEALEELDGDIEALADATQTQLDAKLSLTGGSMSGTLTVLMPTLAGHAARKDYVDGFLPKSGGTMVGNLTLASNPSSDLHATPKQYVDGLGTTFRNVLINGNFDIWQRGTSLAAASGSRFLADRWNVDAGGSSTAAPARQSFTPGQTDVPNNPTYFHRAAVVSGGGAGSYAALLQRVAGAATLSGGNATVSFWAKATASGKFLSAEFLQNFGTGGSPSATVTAIGATKLALTTSWQKFTVTAAVPSVAGKTLGSDGNDSLQLTLWLDAGSSLNSRTASLGNQSGTIDIAQVQLEEGTVASRFELRRDLELQLAQRYFVRLALPNVNFGAHSASVLHSVSLAWPQQMRREPTLGGDTSASVLANCTSLGFNTPTTQHVRLSLQSTGATVNASFTSNGSYLDADAEI